MPTVRHVLLVLLQLISYGLSAQHARASILENALNEPSEILPEDYFDSTIDIAVAIEFEPKESQSLAQPTRTNPSTSSKDDKGENPLRLHWSLGLGIGHSSHASSYAVDDGFRIKEFSGFRSIVLDTKIGLRFHEIIGAFGTWKFAPGNSIISPYRSNYLGGGLAIYFGYEKQFSIHGGLGSYQAKVDKNEILGSGLLINYGAMIQLSNNFGFEFNILSGKIEADSATPFRIDSTEFNVVTGVAILF